MRMLRWAFIAIAINFGLAAQATAQNLPSDVEQKLGIPRNSANPGGPSTIDALNIANVEGNGPMPRIASPAANGGPIGADLMVGNSAASSAIAWIVDRQPRQTDLPSKSAAARNRIAAHCHYC